MIGKIHKTDRLQGEGVLHVHSRLFTGLVFLQQYMCYGIKGPEFHECVFGDWMSFPGWIPLFLLITPSNRYCYLMSLSLVDNQFYG